MEPLCFLAHSVALVFNKSTHLKIDHTAVCVAKRTRRYISPITCVFKPPNSPDPEPAPKNGDEVTPTDYKFAKLVNRLAAARQEYEQRSDQLGAMQQPTDNAILGSELSAPLLSSTTIIQDLPVPTAPKYFGLAPRDTLTILRDYLLNSSVDVQRCDAIETQILNILACLRASTFERADYILPILTTHESDLAVPSKKVADALDTLIALLQTARFVVLPDLPQVGEPPSPNAVPLGLSLETNTDPTFLAQSSTLCEYIKDNGVSLDSPSIYPYLFIATRGVSVSRKSGLLVSQKIRALERACFSFIRTPLSQFVIMSQSLRASARRGGLGHGPSPGSKSVHGNSPEPDNNDSTFPVQRVRRVVPAVMLDGGLNQLSEQFMPSVTQEPCHEQTFLLFREVIPDKKSIRKNKRKALLNQFRESIMQAVNPMPSSMRKKSQRMKLNSTRNIASFERSPGALNNATMQMFINVPWGTIRHIFPSTYVLPATRDLLRVDALTFTGLVSALITYARHPDSSYVFGYLGFSAISYSIRVALGWRNAVLSYNSIISKEKLSNITCQGRSCIDSIATLAVEEAFVDVACVWVARKGFISGANAMDIQNRIFGKCCLDQETVRKWCHWLDKSGFGGEQIL